jgi:hypothetical protein
MKTAAGVQIQSPHGWLDFRFSTTIPKGIVTSRLSTVFKPSSWTRCALERDRRAALSLCFGAAFL